MKIQSQDLSGTREISVRRNFTMLSFGLLWICMASFAFRSSGAWEVFQTQNTTTAQEGESVTLKCTYISLRDYYYTLYWYKQSPNGSMDYLIYQDENKPNVKWGRYLVNFRKPESFISLLIVSLKLEDSAKYFCALIAGGISVPTSQLKFGNGTQLIVEPKHQPTAKPSVFVMRNGTNVACLVKDFYPKAVNISLQSSKVIKEYDPSVVLSPSGKYSAVKLGQYNDSDSVTCSVQHENKTVNSNDFEQKTNALDTVPDSVSDNRKPTESENIINITMNIRKPKVNPEKVNMMSLTVLGLRILFVKSVAINILFTAKLFFF